MGTKLVTVVALEGKVQVRCQGQTSGLHLECYLYSIVNIL